MRVTRFGLQIPNFTFPGVADGDLFERIAQIAVAAEESGFDSVWVMDHFYQIPGVGPRTDPMLEAYTLLGAIAARTRRAASATMVTGVTYRNPALLAKTVTTLDLISRAGRSSASARPGTTTSTPATGSAFPPSPSAWTGSKRRSRSAGRCSPRRPPASPAATTPSPGP